MDSYGVDTHRVGFATPLWMEVPEAPNGLSAACVGGGCSILAGTVGCIAGGGVTGVVTGFAAVTVRCVGSSSGQSRER